MSKMPNAAFVLVAFGALVAPVVGQNPVAKSPEMKLLDRYVGTWEESAVSKPAAWTPDRTTLPIGISNRQWILNGLMVENRPATREQPQYVHLMTWDPQRKQYVQWYSNEDAHVLTEYRGDWNAATSTFTLSAKLADGSTAVNQQKWLSEDAFDWTYVIKDRAGQVLLDVEGKAVRKK